MELGKGDYRGREECREGLKKNESKQLEKGYVQRESEFYYKEAKAHPRLYTCAYSLLKRVGTC